MATPDQAPVRPPPTTTLKHLWLAAAASYGLGQVANLVFQWRLLEQLGAADYGAVGLAHLLLVTLIFLADLGYSSIFLREPLHATEWEAHWRQALGHKLIATLVLMALTAAGSAWLWGSGSASRAYLLGAAPACLFALGNYASPLIASGRRLTGLLVAQVAWPVALLLWWLLQAHLPLAPAACAGLSVSLGYLVQAWVGMACSGRLRLWLPQWGRGQLGAALNLSMLSVCGTLHDRLTPFLLAPLAPGFLPFFLILSHVLNGLSGVLAQVARLLLPAARTGQGRDNTLGGVSWVLWGTLAALAVGVLVSGLDGRLAQRQWLALGATVVLAWGLSAASSFLTTVLISDRRERSLMHLLVLGLSLSAMLQGAAALAGAPGYLLWARALGMLVMLIGLLALLDLRPTAWGMALLVLAPLACKAVGSHWSLTVGLFAAVAAGAGLLRQVPCLRLPRALSTHP